MTGKKTNWFPSHIKPVRSGWYEVNMRTWPWPTMIRWTRSGWKSNALQIKSWRGLKEKA
jgi:hypothetical protein